MESPNTPISPLPMQQAVAIIRPSLLTKLTDRTYLNTILSASTAIGGTIAIWQTPHVPITDKINVTIMAIGAVATVVALWNHKQTTRDETIWKTALEASAPYPRPETVNQNITNLPGSNPSTTSPEPGQTSPNPFLAGLPTGTALLSGSGPLAQPNSPLPLLDLQPPQGYQDQPIVSGPFTGSISNPLPDSAYENDNLEILDTPEDEHAQN